MSGSSSWNHSGFAFAPNTNTMDANAMPSDKAQAARERAAEIMAASKKGEPGDADRMMGEREPKGNVGLLPIDFFKSKFSRKKGTKEDKKASNSGKTDPDGVIR